MSERIEITSASRGQVWVFAVDIDATEIKTFTAKNGDWPMARALGVETLETEHVEVFPVTDLEGVGLVGYLEQGLGVAEDQLDGLRARLDGIKGVVMVLTARAFGNDTVVLTPSAPLRLVASFSEDRPPVQFEPLPSDAAKGTVAGPASDDETVRGRGWSGPLFLVLAAILITLIAVWVS